MASNSARNHSVSEYTSAVNCSSTASTSTVFMAAVCV